MYAIVNDGSRQHPVKVGDLVDLEYRKKAEKGQKITLEGVLLYADGEDVRLGTPTVAGVVVEGEVQVERVHGPKLKVQKYRRRESSKAARGHKQKYVRVKITRIEAATGGNPKEK